MKIFTEAVSRHSRRSAPMFSAGGDWLAVRSRGAVVFYPLSEEHLAAGPCETAKFDGDVQAQGPYGKSLGVVYAKGNELIFRDFPGRLFGADSMPVERPESGFSPWRNRTFVPEDPVRAFHFAKPGKGTPNEWVYAVDRFQNLVCWHRQRIAGKTSTSFTVLENGWRGGVYGVQQNGGTLRYALQTQTGAQTLIVDLDVVSGDRTVVEVAEVDGLQVHFAGELYAVQAYCGLGWHVFSKGSATVTECDPLANVIGCASMPSVPCPGLIFLSSDNGSIQFRAGTTGHTLIDLSEPAASAAYDPLTRRVAWIGKSSGNVTVQCIDDSEPLLIVSANG